jgi:hypothetical protein
VNNHLTDATLDLVSGGTKIGDAAQKVSGLFKAASDIGQAASDQLVSPAVASLLEKIGHGF